MGLARAKRRRGTGKRRPFRGRSPCEFHEKLRSAYRALAATEPKRCIVIDGRAPREVVADRIWAIVDERLLPRTEGSWRRRAP